MLTPFGKALRQWRMDNEMTLCEMAKNLFISISALSSLECGRKEIDVLILQKILFMLNLSETEARNLLELAWDSNEAINND